MGFKQTLASLLRKSGLSGVADKCRFYWQYLRRFATNQQFAKQHPAFVFPPAYFIYETYTLNYKDYFEDGKMTAGEIIDLVKQYLDIQQPLQLLDWGCGPARVVRHMPALLNAQSKVYGCDYNSDYIQWGSQHLKEISFVKNELLPPVPLAGGSMNIIYGLSIFTHLSEKNHYLWIDELHRLLQPGGVLLITTQGEKFKHKLLPEELATFEKGKLVERGFEKEGHRMYSAFEPEPFMQQLLKDFQVLRFIPGGSAESVHAMQDTWIVKKKSI